MRTLTVLLFCLFFNNILFTQVNNLLHCGQIAVSDIEKSKQLERSYKKLLGTKNQKSSYTLPIVVHVLYDDIGNIPDQQVDDAINYLNSAFANLVPYNPMTGVDTELAFCLAARNPEGNFTTGINRIQTSLATSANTAEEIAQLSNWNSSDYINIYVVPSLCNALGEDCNFIVGYASAPSLHGSSKDGIYIQTDYFGTSPENTAALVHEMGHYLGLLHTFQGGCENSDCLEDGDKVCDTPPDNSIVYMPCGENMNSCDTDVNFGDPNNPLGIDFPDMTWNYMDYGFSCYSAFTQGQKDRMHFFLENARQSLLESDACVPGCTSLIIVDFLPSTTNIEVGQTILFNNISLNATNYDWLINGIFIDNTTNFLHLFEEEGIYSIELQASNNDTNCYEKAVVTIEVTCPIIANFSYDNQFPILGDTIIFYNNSQNEESLSWYVNGSLVGQADTLKYVVGDLDSYFINIVGANAFCENNYSELLVIQGNCQEEVTNFQFRYTDDENNDIHFNDLKISSETQEIFALTRKNNAEINICKFDSTGKVLLGKKKTPLNLLNHRFVPYAIGGLSQNSFLTMAVMGTGGIRKDLFVKFDTSLQFYKSKYLQNNIFGQQSAQIEQLPNGDYLILKGHKPAGSNIHSIYLLRLSSELDLVWSKKFSVSAYSLSRFELKVATNGDFYVEGSLGTANSNIFLWKFKENGSLIWSKIYDISSTNDWSGRSDICLDGEDLYITGWRFDFSYLIKLDTAGIISWSKKVQDINDGLEEFQKIRIKNESGIISGIYNRLPPNSYYSHFIVGINSAGSIISEANYEFDYAAYWQDIESTGTDNFLLHASSFLGKTTPLGYQGECNRVPNLGISFEDFPGIEVRDTFFDIIDYPIVLQDTIFEFENYRLYRDDPCELLSMDAAIQISDYQQCPTTLEINTTICNQGLGNIYESTLISAYNYHPNTDTSNLIGQFPIGAEICQDSCLNITLSLPTPLSGNIYLVVNDDGSFIDNFDLERGLIGSMQRECQYGNNLDSLIFSPYTIASIDSEIDTLFICEEMDSLTLNLPFSFSTYNWNNDTQDSILIVNSDGQYAVTVTDECDFEQTKSWEVIQESSASLLDLGQDISLCEGSIQILEVPNQYPSIIWQDGSFDTKLTAWHPGIYWVEVTDACGNIQRDSIEITLNEDFNLDLGEDVVLCQGDTFTISAASEFDNYQWSPKENLSCDTCSTITFVVDSTVTIALQASNDDGCYSSDTLNIQVFQHQEIFIDSFLCDTESISFNGIEINDGESYTFDLQNVAGCDSTVTVQYNSFNSRQTEETINICPNESALIFDTLISESGVYSKIFSTYQGCDSIHSINLFVYEDFDFSIETIPTCEAEDSGQATILTEGGTPPFSYDWLTISGEESVVNNLPFGTYQVVVSDSAGCNQTADFSIPFYLEDVAAFHCEPQVFAPNVFSPNDDSINDFFYLQSNERVVAILSLKIFDRYGELVFENKDIIPNEENSGWNGIFRGKLMNPQVFIWQAEVQFLSGEQKVFYGDVVLLR